MLQFGQVCFEWGDSLSKGPTDDSNLETVLFPGEEAHIELQTFFLSTSQETAGNFSFPWSWGHTNAVTGEGLSQASS